MSSVRPDELEGVSRETSARLSLYLELLRQWNARINLVAPASLEDGWRRHIVDSAQLFPHIPRPAARLVDFGSGAGFPGLVLAILGCADVHLVDSDARKCVFMREVARQTGVSVTVHKARIEDLPPFSAAVVTARALAPLDRLLQWSTGHLAPEGKCLFLKGKKLDDELTAAASSWRMQSRRWNSVTDPTGGIVEITEIERRKKVKRAADDGA